MDAHHSLLPQVRCTLLPSTTAGPHILQFISQAGGDLDTQGEASHDFQGQTQRQVRELTEGMNASGVQLHRETDVQQPTVSIALEELEDCLEDLRGAHTQTPRSVILDKIHQNLGAVKLEVQQKQTKLDQLERERSSMVLYKERLKRSIGDKEHRLVQRMTEVTRKQNENGALIDSLFDKFSQKEKELMSLKCQLAEKEKEQYQSRVTINQLQVQLHYLSNTTESLKQKHQLLCYNNKTMAKESGSSLNSTHCVSYCYGNMEDDNKQRRTLSLDQRIMKARTLRKPSGSIKCRNSDCELKLSVELEIARIRSCSLQVDRILDLQYGEVQKLLLRWKATGSDQLMRIWTF